MELSDFVREYFKICCDKNWDGAEILQCWPARNRPARNRPARNLPPALQGTTLGRNAVLGTKKFDNTAKTVPGGNQYKEYYFPIGKTADKNLNRNFRFLYSQSLYKKNKPYVLFSDDHYESYFILQEDGQNYPTTEFEVSSSRIDYCNSDHFWHVKLPNGQPKKVTAQNNYFTDSPFKDGETKKLKDNPPKTITKYDNLTEKDAKCYYWPTNSDVLLEFTKL